MLINDIEYLEVADNSEQVNAGSSSVRITINNRLRVFKDNGRLRVFDGNRRLRGFKDKGRLRFASLAGDEEDQVGGCITSTGDDVVTCNYHAPDNNGKVSAFVKIAVA